MNKISACTKERKKQLSVDLLIIAIVTFIVLLAVVIFTMTRLSSSLIVGKGRVHSPSLWTILRLVCELGSQPNVGTMQKAFNHAV